MTNSKKEEKKEKEVKTVSPTPAYDWKEALNAMEIPRMTKKGVVEYVESRNLTIKNERDLKKALNNLNKSNVGA